MFDIKLKPVSKNKFKLISISIKLCIIKVVLLTQFKVRKFIKSTLLLLLLSDFIINK